MLPQQAPLELGNRKDPARVGLGSQGGVGWWAAEQFWWAAGVAGSPRAPGRECPVSAARGDRQRDRVTCSQQPHAPEPVPAGSFRLVSL